MARRRPAAARRRRERPAGQADRRRQLPLQRGYYVASDTPCAQASNATLQLLRRNGIGAARTLCEFKAIKQTGPTSYRVRESCSELGSTTAAATESVSYEVAK